MATAIEPVKTFNLSLPNDIGALSVTGWIPPADMTRDEWVTTMHALIDMYRSRNWVVGDGLVYGEDNFGEDFSQVLDNWGWTNQRIWNAVWVSRAIPHSLRKESLSWTHHSYVASDDYSLNEKRHWLDLADENGWSSRELKERLDAERSACAPAASGNGHKPAPLPSDFDEPAEYMAALYSGEGESGDIPDSPHDSFDDWTPPNTLHSSESQEWYTPNEYVDAVREVLGGIDLDPASCEIANRTVKATHYYTLEDDGLERPWYGRVFLNPPYGKTGGDSNQGKWSDMLIWHYEHGEVDEGILLVNATPSNKWFAPLWDYPICFVDHRIKFYNATDEPSQPTHSNCFVYLGPNPERFAKVFNRFGVVAVRYES